MIAQKQMEKKNRKKKKTIQMKIKRANRQKTKIWKKRNEPKRHEFKGLYVCIRLQKNVYYASNR